MVTATAQTILCRSCRKTLPATDFSPSQRRIPSPTCRSCISIQRARYRERVRLGLVKPPKARMPGGRMPRWADRKRNGYEHPSELYGRPLEHILEVLTVDELGRIIRVSNDTAAAYKRREWTQDDENDIGPIVREWLAAQ